MASETFILGGYQTDFARNWMRQGQQIPDILTEIVEGALEETGVPAHEIETGHVGNFAAELYAMQGHLGAFLVQTHPAFRGLPTSRQIWTGQPEHLVEMLDDVAAFVIRASGAS